MCIKSRTKRMEIKLNSKQNLKYYVKCVSKVEQNYEKRTKRMELKKEHQKRREHIM